MKSLALCTLRIKSGCTKFPLIKGQLISKRLFGIIVFTKNQRNFFSKGFLPSLFKRGQINTN